MDDNGRESVTYTVTVKADYPVGGTPPTRDDVCLNLADAMFTVQDHHPDRWAVVTVGESSALYQLLTLGGI